LDDWIYWHLIHLHSFGTRGNYSAVTVLHTLQFTVAHALGFSVFTSRILATDLSQSHCHFKSHIKSSYHSLISFLPLFCNSQLNSALLLPSSYPGRLASRNPTRRPNWILLYNHFVRTTQKTGPLYWGSYSIVACIFVAAGMCLRSRCLAITVPKIM
jgi:hypothetical protein